MSSVEKKQVKTERLGLAAYMKMKGCEIVSVKKGEFLFMSERPIKEWEIEYANSCCNSHDVELCELRKLLR